MNIDYTIDQRVFALFPGYVRGIVVASEVTNHTSPPELISLLRQAEEQVRDRLNLDDLLQQESIDAWRNAYRAFGAKPSKFRPSFEAMVRRVLRGNELPSIRSLVDIGNICSLRHLVPIGAHGLDYVKQSIALRPADGTEVFTPFGSDETERAKPSEIILAEGNTVLTRRWTWRQSFQTATYPDTKNIVFNIDALPYVDRSDVDEIADEITSLVAEFCGGSIEYTVLSEENPTAPIREVALSA